MENINTRYHYIIKTIKRMVYNDGLKSLNKILLLIFILLAFSNKNIYGQCKCVGSDPNGSYKVTEVAVNPVGQIIVNKPGCDPRSGYIYFYIDYKRDDYKCYSSKNDFSEKPEHIQAIAAANSTKGSKFPCARAEGNITLSTVTRGRLYTYPIEGEVSAKFEYYIKPYTPSGVIIESVTPAEGSTIKVKVTRATGAKLKTFQCGVSKSSEFDWNKFTNIKVKTVDNNNRFNYELPDGMTGKVYLGIRTINPSGTSSNGIKYSPCFRQTFTTVTKKYDLSFSRKNPDCNGGKTSLTVKCTDNDLTKQEFFRLIVKKNNKEILDETFPLKPGNRQKTFKENLNGGDYTFQIYLKRSGGDAFQTEGPFRVTHPPKLRITSTTIKNVSCSGGSDGAITINATGGTGTKRYSLSQSGPFSTNKTISGLSVGTYTVWVRDNNSCLASSSATVGLSENFTINSVTAVDEKCVGSDDGEIVFDVTGSNAPFQYSIDGGANYSINSVIGDLSPGTYNNFVVKDNNGCEKSYSGEVTINPAIPLIIDSVSPLDVTICADSLNGSIFINASGGASGYEYIVNGVDYPSSPVTGLGKGTYTISVRDANGCIENWLNPVVIGGPELLEIDNIIETDVTGCYGDRSGELEIVTSGGTTPLLYILIEEGIGEEDDSVFYQDFPVFTGLLQNLNYSVIVRDHNGCRAEWEDSIVLDGPVGVLLDSVHTKDVTGCFYDSNGEIEIFAHGGTPELSYSIDGGENYQTENKFTGVSIGTYYVTSKDGEGCTRSYEGAIHVSGPNEVSINSIVLSDPIACYGDSTGSIFVTASAEGDTLSYSINGGTTYQEIGEFTNLPAGNYTIRVKNNEDCFIDTTVQVTQNPEIEILSVDVTNVTCNGENDGTITINAIGGVDLTYSINDTTYWTENTIGSLAPVSYNVFVKDMFSCKKQWDNNPVTILEPTALSFIDTTFIPPTCTDKGDVTVEATGGTPFSNGYNYYLINDTDTISSSGFSVTFENAVDYVSDLYIVEVVDSNGCSVKKGMDDWVITVTANSPITITDDTIISPTCFGGDDGLIEILEVTGGTGVYVAYEWTRPGWNDEEFSGEKITNLDFGPYSLTITDNAGCKSNGTMFLVENPPQMEIIAEVTDVGCIGETNGSIVITGIENGVSEYTYEWADSTGTGTIQKDTTVQNNLSSGIYNITVTDSRGCERQDFITVNDPEILVASIIPDSSYNGFDVACFNSSGSATAQATGGTGDYTFEWSNGTLTDQSAGLIPGEKYTVTVTDGNNCTDTTSIILTEPEELETLITPDSLFEGIYHVKCFGDKGSAIAFASGGIAPYNYEWSNGVLTQQGTGLDAGVACNVIVHDDNGCTDTAFTTLRQPEELSTIVTPDSIYNGYDVACYGNEGSATASVNGGIYPYSYNWSNGEVTPTATLQSEIEYSVTVTDKLHCVDTATIILDAPNSFIINVESDNDYNGYDVSCFGDLGSATAYGIDGVPPYIYEWSNGQTTAQATLLQPGVAYSITMTDANGCTAIGDITLEEPDSLYISEKIITDVKCKGENSGTVDITVTGGAVDYNFLWSTLDGSGLDPSEENQSTLTAGTYIVNVTDANLCSFIDSVTIEEPESALSIAITDQVNVTCNSYFNGSVTLEAANGWGNFKYSKDSVSYQTPNIFDHLPAASYEFFVKDQGGCVVSVETEITQSDALSANITIENEISCFEGNDGSFSVATTGGTAPYRYSIDNGYTIQQSEIFSQLSDGSYSILIIDTNNCTLTKEVDIIQPQQIELSIVSISEATCGNTDGNVTVEASSGSPPYTYEWKDLAVFSPELTNVSAGVYELNITDSRSCERIFYVDINNSDGPSLEVSNINNASCFSAADGSASVSVTNGTPPLQFLWNDPLNQTSSEATGLSPGTYTVTLTDASGCDDQLAIDVGPENEISIDIVSEQVTCKDGNDTYATASASNGTWPYTYKWENELGVEIGSDSTVTGLSAGKYIVEVWDANNCPDGLASPGITDTVTISEPFLPLEIEVVDKIDATCNGDSNGWVQVFATGGWGQIEYSDDNINYGSTTLFTGLSAGDTEIFARDSKGCVISIIVQIVQPDPLLISAHDITHASCNGDSNASVVLTASGGTPPYYYRMGDEGDYSKDSIFNNLPAGMYTFYVKDKNDCEATGNIEVTEPEVISISVLQNIGSTCGHPDGSVTVEASGGTQPYLYQWDDDKRQTTARVSALLPGIYNVTVSDAHNCMGILEVEVENIPGPAIEVQTINSISCVGDTDGSARISITGGEAPYTILWNDLLSQTETQADNLAAGIYQVVVTDINVCSDTLEVTIPSVDSLVINLDNLTNPTCVGDQGSISVSGLGGTSPYFYIWDNGEIESTITDLSIGNYGLTVIDAHNCVANNSYNITGGGEEVIVDIPESATVCQGQPFTIDAGHPSAHHEWSSENGFNSSDQVIELLVPGTYTVIVTNNNGCTGTADFELIASDNSLDAGILMVDEANVGDTIVICELSWPIPDSIIWEIPENFTDVGEDQDHKFLIANEPGKYTIYITAFFKDCMGYTENTIVINNGDRKDLDIEPEDSEDKNIIKLIELYPNPTSSNFTLKVNLSEENDIEIELFKLSGLLIFEERAYGETEYTFTYNTDNLEKGYYLLIVKSKGFKKTIRLIKN